MRELIASGKTSLKTASRQINTEAKKEKLEGEKGKDKGKEPRAKVQVTRRRPEAVHKVLVAVESKENHTPAERGLILGLKAYRATDQDIADLIAELPRLKDMTRAFIGALLWGNAHFGANVQSQVDDRIMELLVKADDPGTPKVKAKDKPIKVV